jgi:cystathionine beta-lyase
MQSATGSPDELETLVLAEIRRRMSHKWRSHDGDVVPLSVAEMDFPVFGGVKEVITAAVDRSDFGYPPPEDRVGFGRTVARWLGEASGMSVDPSLVVALPDVVRGLDSAVIAFTEPGDGVIVTPPIYPPFLTIAGNHHRSRMDVPLIRHSDGTWHLDLQGIDTACRNGGRVILLCHPHNPTGTVFDDEELTTLVEVARLRGAILISDEIHAPLTFAGGHSPLVNLHPDGPEVVVTLTSASKAWNLAGLKCGIGLFHNERSWERFTALPRPLRSGVGILGMLATLEVISSGGAWLAQVLAYLDRTRSWLVEAVAEYLPGVDYRPPQASFLAWLDFSRTPIAADPAGSLLSEAGVALQPGREFGPVSRSWARLNFGTSRGILEHALARMSPVVTGVLP